MKDGVALVQLEKASCPVLSIRSPFGLIVSAAVLVLPLIATTPAAAEIKPFPASFRGQQMPVTGGTQYVRIGGQGPAVRLSS
jgi:hypothetical protein